MRWSMGNQYIICGASRSGKSILARRLQLFAARREQEPKVCGLSAGGRRIRTLGPSHKMLLETARSIYIYIYRPLPSPREGPTVRIPFPPAESPLRTCCCAPSSVRRWLRLFCRKRAAMRIAAAGDRLLPSPRIGSDQINAESPNRTSGTAARSHARVFCRRWPLDARPL
jgi:hypothetical protein